jgi:hypothetical protein
MTRFSASGPRISYTPTEGPKPVKQIIGLYNMWQSLSPDTRNWIASLFSGKDKSAETVDEIQNPEVQMAGYDPNLDMSMTREEPAGWDQDLIDYGSNMVVGLPVEVGNKILVPETWDAPIISREDAQAEGKAESKKRRFAGMPELGETTYQAWGML